MVCGLCHREPEDHTESTSGPTRCEYLDHRKDCPGNFRTSCTDHKTKVEATHVEEKAGTRDDAMVSLEQGLKSLQLTPDSNKGLLVHLQQLMAQQEALKQPVLDPNQDVLQQLGALLQSTPSAENKMNDNSEFLSSLTNLFKTPNATNPPQPSPVQESAGSAQASGAPALDNLARDHVASNQPYLEVSKPQSSYNGPTINDIRQDKPTQGKVSLVIDAIKSISPVFGQTTPGIQALPGISPLDQLKQHLAGNTGALPPNVSSTPLPSQQPQDLLQQLRSLLSPPQPAQSQPQHVHQQPQDLLQQLKELLIPNTPPQPNPPVFQQPRDPIEELRSILLQQLPTAPPPLYGQQPVYVPQHPTLLSHQVPHQPAQTAQHSQLLATLQGILTTPRNPVQQFSAIQPQPTVLPQAQPPSQLHQMTLQQLLQHPGILQQLGQPSPTQPGLLELPKQQQSQPQQQPSQPRGAQGMSQVRHVHVRPTEFSRNCQVDYSEKVKSENANLVMFCYGYISQINLELCTNAPKS